jgi:ParB family chromosome partitioning protein
MDALDGLSEGLVPPDRVPRETRFLQRSNRVAERLSGEVEEKTLRRVDPARCRMWARHNRAYDLLTEDNCRDLIDGIRSQGRQEFPAVVRETDDPEMPYEVICGARRHFAVSWLRANNYQQFRYLIEVRDLSDEEAFRLADIENRDREDISDYERAVDYLDALERYYGGEQKAMAERLEMSRAYLSRFLQLARLPREVIEAFASVRDLRELHARSLKPHLGVPETREAILAEARALKGQGLAAAEVVKRLFAAARPPAPLPAEPMTMSDAAGRPVLALRRRGRHVVVEIDARVEAEDAAAVLRELADTVARTGWPE